MKTKISWAGGSKGPDARSDGNGKLLARGYWYKKPGFALGVSMAGPFKTKMRALESLVVDLEEVASR